MSDLRDDIVLRVGAGQELAGIERELIDPAMLSEDDKAALWLFPTARTRPSLTAAASDLRIGQT